MDGIGLIYFDEKYLLDQHKLCNKCGRVFYMWEEMNTAFANLCIAMKLSPGSIDICGKCVSLKLDVDVTVAADYSTIESC